MYASSTTATANKIFNVTFLVYMFFEFISFGKFKKEYLIHYLYRENYYNQNDK